MVPTAELHEFLDAMQAWYGEGDELARLLDPSSELATREFYAGRRIDLGNVQHVIFMLTTLDGIWRQLTTDLANWTIVVKMSHGEREDFPKVVDAMFADLMGNLYAVLPESLRLERSDSTEWGTILHLPVSQADVADFDWDVHADWIARRLRELEALADPSKPGLRRHLTEHSGQAEGLASDDSAHERMMYVHAWTTLHVVRMLHEAMLQGSELHISRDAMKIADKIELVLFLHLHDAIRALPVEDQQYYGWTAAA